MIPIYLAPSGSINAGQYNIPFQFIMPDNLPGSMHATGHMDGPWHAKIEYTIKVVTFEGCTDQNRFFKLNKE